MANNELFLELDLSQSQESLALVTGQIQGLDRVLNALSRRISGILAGAGLVHYLTDAAQGAEGLSNEFLVLRLALGKLRSAVGSALAPIGQVLLPVLQDAVFAAIGFVKSAGRVIRALLGVSDSADDAAESQLAVGTAVTASARAVQRSLASFDKLNRLNKASGGGGGTGSNAGGSRENYSLNLQELLLVNTLRQLLEPLQKIDLTPLKDSLQNLRLALEPLTEQLFQGLAWGWFNLFVPMAQWTAEQLLPAFVALLTEAVRTLGSTVEACRPALSYLWENFLKPAAQWTGQLILEGLEWLRQKLEGIGDWMRSNQVSVDQLLTAAAGAVGIVLLLSGALDGFRLSGIGSSDAAGLFTQALQSVQNPVSAVTGLVGSLSAALGLLISRWVLTGHAGTEAWQSVKNAWQSAGSWFESRVLAPLSGSFKTAGNGIIAILNGILRSVTAAVNALVRGINQLRFTVPDWVPGLGGEAFGFRLQTMTAPQIPYLAKGAVLPANKPFLAMVGDQRHGTNIEAPLATIEQAVALVMEDVIASSLAGQEAVVGVLRQILEAVLGISIGEADIARAYDSYCSKMAVVRGTY